MSYLHILQNAEGLINSAPKCYANTHTTRESIYAHTGSTNLATYFFDSQSVG